MERTETEKKKQPLPGHGQGQERQGAGELHSELRPLRAGGRGGGRLWRRREPRSSSSCTLCIRSCQRCLGIRQTNISPVLGGSNLTVCTGWPWLVHRYGHRLWRWCTAHCRWRGWPIGHVCLLYFKSSLFLLWFKRGLYSSFKWSCHIKMLKEPLWQRRYRFLLGPQGAFIAITAGN